MEESQLTRKAIEELMREMNDYKEKESMPAERKINPLGKPNKRFLGRTLNSVMTHNKRESYRNYQKCQQKLKELDAKKKHRDYHERYRNHRKEPRRRSKSESTHEVISSSNDEHECKKSKKLKKKKKKKRRKEQKSSSSSSSTSSSSSDSDSISSTSSSGGRKHTKKLKHKNHVNEYEEEYYHPAVASDPGLSYYLNPNITYAAMAYNQMNHILYQQQMAQQKSIEEELEESVEILSDLSLSCPESESCLNISLHSSSAEEDENGILTFNLSSDDEKAVTKKKKTSIKGNHSNSNKADDNESVISHISLESEKSQKEISINISEVFFLNTSSDSELEIVEIDEKVVGESSVIINEIRQKSVEVDMEKSEQPAEEHRGKEENPIKENGKITEEPVDIHDISNKEHVTVHENENEKTNNSMMVDLTND